MRPARRIPRPGRPTAPALAPGPGQRALIRHYQAHPPCLSELAAALGVSREMLRRELLGARHMPAARQVALWYLLEGHK